MDTYIINRDADRFNDTQKCYKELTENMNRRMIAELDTPNT